MGVSAIEPILAGVLGALSRWLGEPPAVVLAAWRERDALLGCAVEWSGGRGTGAGVDGEGRLVVQLEGGGVAALQAGEVHLVG